MRKPQFFPEDISGAIKKFNLEQKDYFIWTNKEGKGVFGIYINDNLKPDKLGRKRTAMPFCFIEGKWSESFGWKDVLDFKRPLYKEEELLTTDKDILVVSGSMTREAASKLYPNYFVTTFYGSSINWENHK